MNVPPNQSILIYYQNMGFSHDLIIQAWNQCKGNQHLLLNTLLRLPTREAYIQHRYQNPRRERIPNSVMRKKMPRTKHIHLKFEGNGTLKYLKLRKLGLFSKKAFKDARSLALEYIGKQTLKEEHIETLANHMKSGLRNLKHLSIKLETQIEWRSFRWELIILTPLFNRMDQSFVSLISLKLALGKAFQFSLVECFCLGRFFAKTRSTLKHLDLDFSGNDSPYVADFSETLGMVIMNRLHKLETLCLNFNLTKTSTRIVRLLMSGSCTHLKHLRSLDISVEWCHIANDWNSHPVHNCKSNLQDLKLNFNGCSGVNLQFLMMLQSDILTFYPKLQRLLISTVNSRVNFARPSNGLSLTLEEKFLQRLNLKWLRLLDSYDIEKNLTRYRKMQLMEMEQILVIQKEVEKIKQITEGEEEICLYLKALIEEEQAPANKELSEQEYLQNMMFEQETIPLKEQDRIDKIEMEHKLIQQCIGDYDKNTEDDLLFLSDDPQDDSYERW